jgi:small subunit ribosomal protein S21|tara:strand:- start:158 stop:367 length:210 start_codon:yes stop_codon:yes gene_type:complete
MVLEVKVRNNNVDKAMRQLKKKVMKDGLLKELKQRQYYEKPSLKRQRLKKESIKRVNKLRRLQERLDDN